MNASLKGTPNHPTVHGLLLGDYITKYVTVDAAANKTDVQNIANPSGYFSLSTDVNKTLYCRRSAGNTPAPIILNAVYDAVYFHKGRAVQMYEMFEIDNTVSSFLQAFKPVVISSNSNGRSAFKENGLLIDALTGQFVSMASISYSYHGAASTLNGNYVEFEEFNGNVQLTETQLMRLKVPTDLQRICHGLAADFIE